MVVSSEKNENLGFMGIMFLCSLLGTSKLVMMAIREDQGVSEFGAFQ